MPLHEGVALLGECGDLDGQPMSALRYGLFEMIRRALVVFTGDALPFTRSVRTAAFCVVRR
jgi:hypothetical protein